MPGTFSKLCFGLLLGGLFLGGFHPGTLEAQTATKDYDRKIQSRSQAVENLKKEIEATKLRLSREKKKEKSAAKRVTSLGQEISLLDRLIRELKREEKGLQGDITHLEGQVTASEQELNQLRERYTDRVVRIYKQGTLSDLAKVLSSTSWRQAVYRTKYLKIISDLDRRTESQIKSLLSQIGMQKLDLEATLLRKRNLKREREQRVAELRRSKRSKQKELALIRRNKTELTGYLKEKQAGVKELETLIRKLQEDKARFERAERIRRQQEALRTKEFATLKGRLPWPAEGRVITKFGRQWNPKLKTTTENPGVDIKGKPGAPIYAILGGVITTITYIRGYGTTVIIDHGGGFYTVYSHVTRIETNVDSEVKAGDVIAYMGDSGSINGSQLHFEVWGQGQKLDPEKWLAAR